MTFTRYAIYFVPRPDEDWSRFGAAWLGWDAETGTALPHPDAAGLDIAAITATPRKYGLHATLKPPMRLRAEQTPEALDAACRALADSLAPVTLDGLQLARLGRFLALRPAGDTAALNHMAAACVTTLDTFRDPATEAELERRRGAGLTPAQEENLTAWGYPYVLDQFRFHITLSGRMPKGELPAVEAALQEQLIPLLPAPFVIRDIALAGEAADGRFHVIHRYALTG